MDYCQLSNGTLEETNRKIKRTTYGYRNWPHSIYQIMIEFLTKIDKKPQFVNELEPHNKSIPVDTKLQLLGLSV